jgi:hypothetical protein
MGEQAGKHFEGLIKRTLQHSFTTFNFHRPLHRPFIEAASKISMMYQKCKKQQKARDETNPK